MIHAYTLRPYLYTIRSTDTQVHSRYIHRQMLTHASNHHWRTQQAVMCWSKAATRNSFGGGWLPIPFLPFPPLSLTSKWPPQIQLTDLGEHKLDPKQGTMTFSATKHVLWVLHTQKCIFSQAPAIQAFFVYLEPRERVWWLQMASYFCYIKSKNWSKCGHLWMYCIWQCSCLLNSMRLHLFCIRYFISGMFKHPKTPCQLWPCVEPVTHISIQPHLSTHWHPYFDTFTWSLGSFHYYHLPKCTFIWRDKNDNVFDFCHFTLSRHFIAQLPI